MKLINSCSTKYNKGGPPTKEPRGSTTRRGTQHTHRRTSHTNIQPNQNHTNTYVRIYTYIYPKEYARIRQSSANEITEIHKTHTEKNGWKSVCFVWTMEFHSVTHAVLFSRGQVSMSLHLWFHLHWYGLHRFHMKRQSPVPSFTHIPKQDIVPKWKRAHREFNIVTHLSHSPLSFNQRFIIFTSLQEGLRSEDKLPDASRPQASPSGHGML